MKIRDLFGTRKSMKTFSIDEKRRSLNEAGAGSSATRDPKSTRVRIVTPRIGTGAAGQFEDSPVDMAEIGKAYHSDSYIRRSVDKITGLMFKSGWNFVSLNQDALEYVQTRFKLIEESTEISTEELLRELGVNYILYANAPMVKTRGQENLGGLQATGYYGGEPISGLFPVSPENFQVKRDEFGNIDGYSVTGGTGSGLEFPPEDFALMTYHRPTGRPYGVPHINNVIDDVLILRQIEENIARLVYRNIFPLQTYTVGRVEPGYEATDEEIDTVTEMIRDAPLDSIIVIPERHKLETVSSNNGSLDAYNYLKYFRQRVFTGLGVSESTMGIGDSSNKSTSDNQSSDLIDLVKDFQQNFTAEIQQNLINEILFEGGFDPTLNAEDRVTFQFTEIEQSAKIARENHEIQKFLSNVQDIDETRKNMNLEPKEDLSRFYFTLMADSAIATAMATAIDPSGTVSNKDMPENQSGKASSPNKDLIKDAFNGEILKENEESLLTATRQRVNLTTDNVKKISKEAILMSNWGFIKEKSLHNLPESLQNPSSLGSIVENILSDDLFSSKKEKKDFVSILTNNIIFTMNTLSKEEQTSEKLASRFYRYEESVLACYREFLSTEEEGGLE